MSSLHTGYATGRSSAWFPFLIMFLFCLLEQIPHGIRLFNFIDLGMYLAPLYFIALYNESDVAPFGVLGLGILKDLLSETPLGYWGILFCLFFIMIGVQRRGLLHSAFRVQWVGFGIMAFLLYLVAYIISLIHPVMSSAFLSSILSALVSFILFPLAYLPFLWMRAYPFHPDMD